MDPVVRFDGEADAEYRFAGRWYEARREHLGIDFLDAVDAAIDQPVAMPQAGLRVSRLPADFLAIAHDLRRPGYWKDRL